MEEVFYFWGSLCLVRNPNCIKRWPPEMAPHAVSRNLNHIFIVLSHEFPFAINHILDPLHIILHRKFYI